MPNPLIATAEDLADRLLFPAAMHTHTSALAPMSHFEALADAGLYGLAGPVEYGGAGVDIETANAVRERLASGCLTTTFVWLQHTTPVLELSTSPNTALRDACLRDMCAERLRAGIALGGLHQGTAGLRAEPVEGGWLISGTAPYVTGWGIIDILLVAALTPDGHALRCLVDARESPSLRTEPLRLLAANASGTVRAHFDRHFVPPERVTSFAPYTPPPAYDGGGRPNGSLALGVARRCLQLIGPSPLDAELDARRRQLDEATDETMAEARAAACALAVRAASALIVHRGSRSILEDDHAARLYREAAFLLVFGSRPPPAPPSVATLARPETCVPSPRCHQ
jgi:alkylation response protein AidB-like acyl-CoA dehydrogenase